MSSPKNIIYPEPPKTTEKFLTKTTLIAFVGILIIVGLYWFGTRSKKETSSVPPPPPIQGDVSIQAGFFTVSQSPGRVTLKQGDIKPVTIIIRVLPLEGFNEPVLFAADNILKDGQAVGDPKILKASFKPETLESKNFEKGTALTINPSTTIAKGTYLINYRVQSAKIKKNFRVLIIVE